MEKKNWIRFLKDVMLYTAVIMGLFLLHNPLKKAEGKLQSKIKFVYQQF